MKGRPLYWILGVLLFVILLQQTCGGGSRCPQCEVSTVTTTTVLPGDSVASLVSTHKPEPIYRDTGSFRFEFRDTGSTRWRDRDVDTLAILSDYFSWYYYVDTVSNDSTMLIIIRDTVTENRILNRSVLFQSLRGNTIITTTTQVVQLRNKIFIGGMILGDLNSLGAGPQLGILTKRDRLIILGVDLMRELPNAQIGVYWKISFRKREIITE